MTARGQVRRALRASVSDLPADSLVLVACSGGPDSVALALAAGEEASSSPYRFGALIVDHQLQQDSGDVAAQAFGTCRAAGLDPVEVLAVQVQALGDGPEAAARRARREALAAACVRWGAAAVLLAHTRDDQAETVLLRLARGSGARTLAGMSPDDGIWRRPLLGLPRSLVHESVGSTPVWIDPHNVDTAFARSRLRSAALPALVDCLGPDVIDGLARSASLLRDDADALDAWAESSWGLALVPTDADVLWLDVGALQSLPRAVRTRLLRRAALLAGAPPAALTREHVLRLEDLIVGWRGQGAADLPGRVCVSRAYGRLEFRSRPPAPEET